MESLPGHDCPCWRLTEPLLDEPLPDHVCVETMIGTLAAAERDGLLPPPLDDRWPLPVGLRSLGFVVRQWAQEEPSATLASQLARLRAWRREARLVEYMLDRGALGDNAASDRFVADRLTRRGLPATPATVRHLRAVIAGDREPLPARGLLVVTRVHVRLLRRPGWPAPVGRAEPPHDVSVTGPLDFTTGPLVDRARGVALAHRDWLGRWGRHRIADVREVRRSQRGAFAPTLPPGGGRFDYRAEALRGLDNLTLLARRHPYGPEGAITDYLDAVYRRVRKRRADAGLPPAPPREWRRELRPLLRGCLRAQR